MPAPVRITEADLREAMRDSRYWRSGHPERQGFARWVTRGWQALYSGDSGPRTSVWVNAYIREGHPVSAHWRGAPSSDGGITKVQDRGSVPPGYGYRLPSPQDPAGRLRYPIEIEPGTNRPATIQGRPYSGHALDRMQGRGLTPSIIDNAVRPENLVRSSRGAHLYWDPTNKLMVVVDPRTNMVITAVKRLTRPRQ